MSLKTKGTAAAVAVMVGLSGATIADPANAAGLGAAGHHKSSHHKKKSHKKKKHSSHKKKSKKKSSIAAKRKKIVKIARKKKGAKYASGATGPKKFDCSGFTKYVYKKAGIKLPRTSSAQKGAGKKISKKKAKKGDIIWSPGHVGIVTKKGAMVDAGNSRVGVSERSYSWMSGAKVIRVKALR